MKLHISPFKSVSALCAALVLQPITLSHADEPPLETSGASLDVTTLEVSPREALGTHEAPIELLNERDLEFVLVQDQEVSLECSLFLSGDPKTTYETVHILLNPAFEKASIVSNDGHLLFNGRLLSGHLEVQDSQYLAHFSYPPRSAEVLLEISRYTGGFRIADTSTDKVLHSGNCTRLDLNKEF